MTTAALHQECEGLSDLMLRYAVLQEWTFGRYTQRPLEWDSLNEHCGRRSRLVEELHRREPDTTETHTGGTLSNSATLEFLLRLHNEHLLLNTEHVPLPHEAYEASALQLSTTLEVLEKIHHANNDDDTSE